MSHTEQAVNFTPGAGSTQLCTHRGSKRDSGFVWQTDLMGKVGCSYTRRKVSSKKPSNVHQSSEVTQTHQAELSLWDETLGNKTQGYFILAPEVLHNLALKTVRILLFKCHKEIGCLEQLFWCFSEFSLQVSNSELIHPIQLSMRVSTSLTKIKLHIDFFLHYF